MKAAAKALGYSTGRELTRVRKRVLSAAGRARIAAAARRRWAKVRAEAKEAASCPPFPRLSIATSPGCAFISHMDYFRMAARHAKVASQQLLTHCRYLLSSIPAKQP